MDTTSRSFISAGLLTMGCLLGTVAASARAQDYARPSRVYAGPARTYAYPSRVFSVPARAYNAPAWTYAQPDRRVSFSYDDGAGVEHDSRYPHWSYDSRETVR